MGVLPMSCLYRGVLSWFVSSCPMLDTWSAPCSSTVCDVGSHSSPQRPPTRCLLPGQAASSRPTASHHILPGTNTPHVLKAATYGLTALPSTSWACKAACCLLPAARQLSSAER